MGCLDRIYCICAAAFIVVTCALSLREELNAPSRLVEPLPVATTEEYCR